MPPRDTGTGGNVPEVLHHKIQDTMEAALHQGLQDMVDAVLQHARWGLLGAYLGPSSVALFGVTSSL